MADALGNSRSPFAPNCIDTEQLLADSVTQDKIADDSVGTDQLAAGVLSQNGRDRCAYAEVDLHAADATIPIGTIPGGSLITDAIAVCSEATDGNGTLTVGNTGDVDGIFTNANITKTLAAVSGEVDTTHGAYLYATHRKPKWIVDDSIINAYVAKGTNTVGILQIYIFYTRGVMSG